MARIQGHLTLIGKQFDTQKVSDWLGTQPTWERHPTEILNNGRMFGHTEWGVRTACFDSNDAKEMIENNSKNNDPDPYGRAGQKKQGRENKYKARESDNYQPRNNRRDGKPANTVFL